MKTSVSPKCPPSPITVERGLTGELQVPNPGTALAGLGDLANVYAYENRISYSHCRANKTCH